MKILIDAMSGDNAPLEILKGVSIAAKEYKDHTLMLVGDENVISHIAVTNEVDIAGIEIIHTDGVLTMEDSPIAVIRDKKNSSMTVGLRFLQLHHFRQLHIGHHLFGIHSWKLRPML